MHEAFGIGLNHSGPDAVMNHLHEMAASGKTSMYLAAIRRRRQRFDYRLHHRESTIRAADRERIAVFQAPDTAGGYRGRAAQ